MNRKENKISKDIKINKKSAKRNYSNQAGITLIALVVTIVVLLILAGVSINVLFGDNGIIKKAQDAQNRMNEATKNDLDSINELNNWIDGKINGTTGGNDNPPTSDLPSVANETIPYYPDETFTKDPDTNLDNGLVIKDTIGNEYVWIEVPKTAEVYPTAGLEIINFTKAEYKAIETDLHTYTDYYRKNKSGTLTKYKDEYYSEATTGLTRAKYTELKQKMLKSVYENGGFWIGRYEAGIEKNRTSSTIDLATAPAPLSKAGTVKNAVYPYTYVKCSQAQTLASKLSTGKSYTSSLMFGVQWDLVLKHIEVKEVAKGTDLAKIQKALRNDSKDWGNYCNATFTINRGEYAEYKNYTLSTTWTPYNQTTSNNFVNSNVKQDQSGGNGGILLTTGASDACKKMNIYDLAGNVWEWTLEYTALTSGPCAGRGGSFLNDGSLNPASGRNFVSTTVSNESIGFRPSLFK